MLTIRFFILLVTVFCVTHAAPVVRSGWEQYKLHIPGFNSYDIAKNHRGNRGFVPLGARSTKRRKFGPWVGPSVNYAPVAKGNPRKG